MILGWIIPGFKKDLLLLKVMANYADDYNRTEPFLLRSKKMAKHPRIKMQCMECLKRFKKIIGPKTFEVKCPKCGSYDTEPGWISDLNTSPYN